MEQRRHFTVNFTIKGAKGDVQRLKFYEKSVWELITIRIMQKIQTVAHDLSRLKENGKLAFRKCFDQNIFSKMF